MSVDAGFDEDMNPNDSQEPYNQTASKLDEKNKPRIFELGRILKKKNILFKTKENKVYPHIENKKSPK